MDYEIFDVDDNYPNIFYRVECIETKKNISCGGYMCALFLLVSLILHVRPDESDEKIATLLSESDDPRAKEILSMMLAVGDIPIPEIYAEDTKNKYCLYNEDEFYEEYVEFLDLSEMLISFTNGEYELKYKRFEIPDEDILYEDDYQIVVSKETYEIASKDWEHEDFFEVFD